MPDPTQLPGDIRTGFDGNTIFDMKMDTFRTLDSVLTRPDAPYLPPQRSGNAGRPTMQLPEGMTYLDALQSNDPKIKDLGVKHLEQETQGDPYFSLGLANEIRTPYEQARKYIDKDFGFDATIPDIEDYYYRNDYMADGVLKRNLIMNPLRFLGRTVVPAALKLLEGVGYVGSMITSVGSSNYWADVADNSFSKWLEQQEQSFKDQVIPVYHQAGFDQKGFFSKLLDANFWTEDVADGVAFMASAAIPAMGFSKLGMIGKMGKVAAGVAEGEQALNWFGKAFSATNKFGKFASGVGVGSPAQLASWTFNTAMEAAVEGSGVYKDAVEKMTNLRARGVADYANMTDEDIRKAAGQLSANTVGGNFAVLGLSNAWENTLFFKPFKTSTPSLMLNKEWIAEGSKAGLSRGAYYGKIAAQGIVAEGLWEENAQLAIQRMNSLDNEGNPLTGEAGFTGFLRQLKNQTGAAFAGDDTEAATSIGLGSLIGMFAGAGFSKLSGERKELISKIDKAIDESRALRNNLFSLNDVYERDEQNNIRFVDNKPVISAEKMQAKREGMEKLFGKLQLSTLEELQGSRPVDMITKKALGEYVASLYNMGVKDVSKRFTDLSPDQAALFGIDNAQVRDKAGEFGIFAKEAEREVERTAKEHLPNTGLSPKDYATKTQAVKSAVYDVRIENLILKDYVSQEESAMLESLNKSRTLNNASLSTFPVEQVNSLKYQLHGTKRLIANPTFTEKLPPVLQKFHLEREKQLEKEIAEFEKNNATFLEESRIDSNGYYVAQHKDADGKLVDSPMDPKIYSSNQKRANYTNTIAQNNWAESNLLANTWHSFYEQLKNIPIIEKIKTQINAEQEAFKNSAFSKYKENVPGDFKKVVRLVGSIISGKTEFSPEEMQLRQNYGKLIEELLPQYEKSLTAETKNIFTSRLKNAVELRDKLIADIFAKRHKIGDLSVSAASLVETLQNRLKDNKVGIEELQTLIYSTQQAITELENSVEADDRALADFDRKISILEEEANAGDFQGIRNTVTELKKEREWVENERKEKKSLLDRLIQTIKEITNLAYKLFADFKGNWMKSRKAFNEHLEAGSFGAIEGFREITVKTLEKNQLEKELADLDKIFNDIDKKVAYYQDIANATEQAVLTGFDNQLKALTRQNEVVKSSTAEKQTTESFSGEMPPVVTNMSMNVADDFDGDDYLRPLNTKFITSTFTDRRVKDSEGNILASDYESLSQAEKDHFHLMEYLTSGKNTAEINKKLGKGKLKIIAVTRHNIEALGLKDLLYTKTEKNDQAKYWEDTDIVSARIDFVHIIEDKGKLYFVDKELNKLGEVGKTEDKEKSKIARTILRAARFTPAEESQYDTQQANNKNWEKDKASMLAYGKEQRKKIMDNSEKFSFENPTGLYSFTVTRGIPVRAEMADGSFPKNPVTDVLLSEEQINGQTVVVTTTGKYTLNESNITLPVGRAYIKTGGIMEKLHYADNNILDENTINTVLAVFDRLSLAYVQKLEEVMAKRLAGKKLNEFPYEERLKIVKDFNKNNKNTFNKAYYNYLNSVVYTGLVAENEKVSPNKIYLQGTYFHFGKDVRIDIADGGFSNNQAARDFLKGIHHNVRYYANTKLAAQSFTEFYLDGTELKERKWKTYNHYLLSKNFPDGGVRSYIPITTQIHTPAQAALESNNAPGTYTSQSIILGVRYAENIVKEKAVIEEDDETELSEEDLDEMEEVSVADLLSGKGSFKKGAKPAPKTQTKNPAPTGSILAMVREKAAKQNAEVKKEITKQKKENPDGPNLPFLQNLVKMKAEKEARLKNGETTKRTEPTPPTSPTNEDDVDWGPGESPFRVITSGFFRTEQDLDAVIEYAQSVLPQFPVERLKKAIQVSPTLEAFGMFTGDAIRLWEGAEEGTLYHEIFEGVANRILSDYEWNAIAKEFKSRKGNFIDRETGETVAYSKATPQQAKEEIAEEFRTFKMTGKLFEGAKNTRTFFQVILDFIRSLFHSRVTIDSIFSDIDEGRLATRTVRARNRFFSNFRKAYPIPYRKYNEFLQGFTSFMFKDIFETSESIVGLDEVGEIDTTLYDRIRARLDDEYITMMEEFANGAFPTDTPNKELNEVNKGKERALNNVIQNWDKIKENWADFVQNHKFYLRKYRIKFDEDYQIPSDESDNTNRNDYTGSGFEVSNKNSSSLSVRFLVGTLMKSMVQKSKNGKYTTGLEQILPNLGIKYSSSRLPELENYDRMMSIVANRFANLNDMQLVEEKMKELSGITKLEQASTIDEQQTIAQALTADEAAFTILYVRMFSPKRVISEESMWNLRTKFLAYTSKQTPTPRILMMQEGSGISIIESTNRSSYEKFHKRMLAAMNRNISVFFTAKKEKETGIKVYTPKEQKKEFSVNFFIDSEMSPEKALFGNFLQFLGLYNTKTKKGTLTPEFLATLKEENLDKYRQLVKTLHDIAGRIQTVKPFSGNINVGNLDIFGYTNNILSILDSLAVAQSEKLMTHLDGNNNSRQNYIPPSFVSRILAEMSNVSSLGELIEAYPHMKKHVTLQDGIYYTDSIMLNRMFNEDGSRKEKLLGSLDYIDGIKTFDDEGGKFKKTAQLEYHQRLGLQFTLSLSGFYNALTADSETEWLFNMGEFVSYTDYLESNEQGKNKLGQVASEFYIPKLEAEIRMALSFNSKSQQLNAIHPETGNKIGQSLRFFKDILQYTDKGKSRELIDKIHAGIKEGTQPSVIITQNRKAIVAAIKSYIRNSIDNTFDNLIENRVISEIFDESGTSYYINDLSTDLENKFGKRHSFSQIKDVISYSVVNSQIANFEQFKLIYGDVAQYKDWEKRAKSMFGPIEQAYFDRTGQYNDWLNNNKNNAEFEGDAVSIPDTDIFNTSFKNHLVGRTLDDVMTKNPELLNTLQEMGAKFDAYEDTNEVDGQSISTLQAFRQLMLKAGWRWTKKFEEFFQFDTALARQELSEAGLYTYSSEELRNIDNRIVERYKDDPPTDGPSPVKTLIPSVRPDGTQDLMKHSVYANSYQLAKGHPELMKLYIDMLNRGDDILNFKSAHKVGADLDGNNQITSHYQRYGQSVSPFEQTDLEVAGNQTYELSFRTLGIQVETQGGGKNQRIGSQLTKDINLNLMPNGVPADFRAENPTLSEEELIHAWNALSPAEKNTSKDYTLVRNTIETLENLKDKSVMDTFDRIGIGYTYKDGKFEYSSVDLIKLQQHIMNEMTRLDIDDNVLDGLELADDMQTFLHASESLPSYNVVSNIIWALSDKSISSLKVNGVPYIQVSSVFFNSGQREATYKDGDKWVRVTNKEDFDRLQKEGKKLFLTSSDLKFYSLERNGEEIQGMEVKLPHIYKKKVNARRKQMGLPILSDEKLMEWLNLPENSRLLEGIGFRIPTQASSSIEFFTIKGFLPEAFGKAVVVPSDITAKAGSDFDVDKLQTYLNNWRLNKKGMPVFDDFNSADNSTLDQRYENVYGGKKKFFQFVEKLLLSTYEKEILAPANTGKAGDMIDAIFGDIDMVSFYSDEEIAEILKENSIDVDYNKLLKQVQEQKDKALPKEVFAKLPIHLQNSRGAVENEYFDSIRQILKQPERFLQLLSPNNMDNIKENRDTVQLAMDPTYKAEEKKELNYSNFLDINYLSDKRHSFIRGKYDIAIFAVNMTNYANSQIVGLGITQGQVRPEDDHIMQAVDYDISLPFEEAPLLNINGWDFIPLGYERSADGRYVMDKISGYINGAVDVAKDPVIIEMGMHSDLANIYMLLERAGIKGKNIALYLMQPSIRDYLRENIFRKNGEFSTSPFQWKKEIIQHVLDKYSTENGRYEKIQFTEEQLTDMLRKGEKIKKELAEADDRVRNGKPRGKVTTWTTEEKRMQWLAFVNFLKIEMFANNMNDVRTSSNHDTAKIRSTHALTRKDLIRDRTYEGNLIMAPTSTGFVNGADAMRQGTFIQKTIDLLDTFNQVFTTTNLFALQNSNPKKTLNKVARRIYQRNPYMKEDDFNAIMKEYDAAVIDTLLNNYAKIGDIQLSSLKRQLFLPAEVTVNGVRHANNLFERFEAIRTDDKYKRLMVDNFLMANLRIEEDTKLGVYTIDLDTTLGREDVLSRNLIIEGWRDLIEHGDEQISKFGEALLYGTIIQYGVKPARTTLTPLIPLEYYSDVSTPVIEMIEEADFTNFDEEVVRENAYKKNFVQQVTPKAMDYVDGNGKTVTIWSDRTDDQIKRKANPSLTQRVFVRNMTTVELRRFFGEEAINEKYVDAYGKEPNGDITNEVFRNIFKDEIDLANARMVSRPAFLWQQYMSQEDDLDTVLQTAQEFVAIRMPRPEFVVMMEKQNRDGSYSPRRTVSKKVREMIDKKDFSWSFVQVYKLVGLDGTKPSVVKLKETTKGENKGKVSISLLYKPVNSAGAFGFNEVASLDTDDNGNVIGRPSILKTNIPIIEQTDEEIVDLLRDNPGQALKFLKRSNPEIKIEQVEPIAPTERVKRNLNITAGKAKPKNYTWARFAKNNYEVSSKGDRRFSAFIAKINKGTLISLPNRPEYVLEKDASIEEIYQVGVKGHKTVNAGKGKAPLTGITKEESWRRYKELWEIFADQNPDLMAELAEKAKGKVLTDQFANTDINQAHALSDILNERNDKPPIEPTCP